MKFIWIMPLFLLPFPAFAATDCHVVEYQDHFEAVCNGDSVAGVRPGQYTSPATAAPVTKVEKAASKEVAPKPQRMHRKLRPQASNLTAAIDLRRQQIQEHRQQEENTNPVEPQPQPATQDTDL